MCLASITKNNLTRKEQSGLGWKVFRRVPTGYIGVFYQQTPILPGKWTEKELGWDQEIGVVSGGFYPTGFHVFTAYKAARHYHIDQKIEYSNLVVKRVRYRRAHTIGTENGGTIVVANEIYIGRRSVRKNK